MVADVGFWEPDNLGALIVWVAGALAIITGGLALVDRLVGPHWVPTWDQGGLGTVLFAPAVRFSATNRSRSSAYDVRLLVERDDGTWSEVERLDDAGWDDSVEVWLTLTAGANPAIQDVAGVIDPPAGEATRKRARVRIVWSADPIRHWRRRRTFAYRAH